MHIILRLICESLRRIAVKISFLWCRKHCVYAAVSFAAVVTLWYLSNVMQNYTSVILYMNIICNTQWLFGANFEILDCSTNFTQRQKRFKQENTFKQTCVDFFYLENMTSFLNYVTATIRALFAWRGSNNFDKVWRGAPDGSFGKIIPHQEC